MIARLTALELANLLARIHPGDITRHSYALIRLLTTFPYLELKAEGMFAHMLEAAPVHHGPALR